MPSRFLPPFCFFTEGEHRFDLEDIEKLIRLTNNFLSFICFEPAEDITEIVLSYETPEGRMLPGFYTTNNYEPKKESRPIINFSELKDSAMQALMQNLLDGKIDVGLILPLAKDMTYAIDLLRYCAAIEHEVGNPESGYNEISEKIRAEINYDELNAVLQEHKKTIAAERRSEFDSAIGVFQKFDGSLKNKLTFAHKKMLSFFDSEHQSWSYPFQIDTICTRVKDFRNGIGHGLRGDKYRSWYPDDVQLLQAMIYTLILTRIGAGADGTRQILGKITGSLSDLLFFEGRKKKSKGIAEKLKKQ